MKPLVALTALVLLADCGGSEAPSPPAAPAASTPPGAPKTRETKAAVDTKAPPIQEASDESLAQLLLEEAGKKAGADKPEQVMTAHHDVAVRHPFTKAGRKAMARCVEVEVEAAKAVDREFAAVREGSESLRKSGKYADAVASLRKYSAAATKESLKRRASAEIAKIENVARSAYGKAVVAARKAIEAGALQEAEKILKAASEPSTEDVKAAAEGDLVLLDRYGRTEEAKRTKAAEDQARKYFGDRAAQLFKRLKERAYAEVLKDLDAAIADPALAVCRDRLVADRAAVAAAASFWEAIQKTLKARVSHEVVLKKTGEKQAVKGTLKKVHESGLSVRVEPPGVEVPIAELDSDTLLLLAINRDGLPEDAGASYAAAAMWFFLEGRHDISRLELATASEMKVDLALLEPAWRQGFFRLALR